jgi:hypothetical protein
MKRVEENNAKPSLFKSLTQHWTRRQILVLAASFVVVLGMVALYIAQTLPKGNREVISEVVDQPLLEELKPAAHPAAPVTGVASGAGSSRRHLTSSSRGHFRSAGRLIVTPQTAAAPLLSQTPETLPRTALNDQGAARSDGGSRDVLRIEIQTGDPSIRIIWFAPKDTKPQKSNPETD